MKTYNHSTSGSRVMDALVLSFSFLLFSLITGLIAQTGFLTLLVLHVLVLFVSMRLGKRIVSRHVSLPSRMAVLLAGNLLGILAGNLVLAALLPMLSLDQSAVLVNLIASAATFFVLGTLSPVLGRSRDDVIAH